ncbi:hypothetical protein NPIL_30451, partial [Nephila pilipes]
ALEAIDSYNQSPKSILPSPTTSGRTSSSPTKLINKFQSVFPEIFTKELFQCSPQFKPTSKNTSSSTSPAIVPLNSTPKSPVALHNSPPKSPVVPTNLLASNSDQTSFYNDHSPTSAEITCTVDALLDSVVKKLSQPPPTLNTSYSTLLEDLHLTSSSSSSNHSPARSHAPSDYHPASLSSSSSPPKDDSPQVYQVHNENPPLASHHNPVSPLPINSNTQNLQEVEVEEPSILDLLLPHSQDLIEINHLQSEAIISPPKKKPSPRSSSSSNSINHPDFTSFIQAASIGLCKICLADSCLAGFRKAFPPSLLPSAPQVPSNDNIKPGTSHSKSSTVTLSYANAVRNSFCKICNEPFSPDKYKKHILSHNNSSSKTKLLQALQDPAFPTTSHQSNTSAISPIEQTFREKFPELRVFQNPSSSSPSPEAIELAQKLDSPPTGPPPKKAFSRKLYSEMAKKNLHNCPLCNKKFYSDSGLKSHLHKEHKTNNSSPANTPKKPIAPEPPLPCCISSTVDVSSSPKVFQNISVKKGVFRCKYCEKPFDTLPSLSTHLKKIHLESPPKVQFRLFPSPK